MSVDTKFVDLVDFKGKKTTDVMLFSVNSFRFPFEDRKAISDAVDMVRANGGVVMFADMGDIAAITCWERFQISAPASVLRWFLMELDYLTTK